MTEETNRKKLIAGAAIAALVLGGGGVMLGRTVFAPATTASADAEEGEHGEEENHGPKGFVMMDDARAKAAGIVTEATQAGALGAEIIAQGVVAAAPNGEAVLTARADGALTRIVKQLGDSVSAGETIAYLESRDAGSIAAERSAASARLIAARAAYAREKKLFDARVTTLGSYVAAGTELFRVADPRKIQINASVLPADARRVQPGDRAVIELLGGDTINATVRAVTPSLDPESKAATIVLVPDGFGQLTPGQGLRVRITPRNAAPSVSVGVPEEAVQSVEGRDVVFVQTPKGFQATNVTIGQRSAGRVEIVAGLKPGAVVATKGAFLLKAELGKGEAEH
jgi:cobalt-zinc-cadmium efflux system membrane fusion protein